MTVEFEIEGQKFVGLNGGPQFQFSEAISFVVNCKDQKEVDALWEKLTAGGGQPSVCGWLKDRFGLSWQIVPARFWELMEGDPKRGERVMAALMQMTKIDLAALEKAAKG
jgi:predicted 3-demethylubiquinone-9 3-methyltransferase (glyoxalase superfamily)